MILDQSVIKLGRHGSAHVLLDHPDVSRLHAVIERNADETSIVDLVSSTGTRVNGRKVEMAALTTGDAITIGPFQILVKHCSPS